MDWQVQYLRSIGAPTTASNIKFLNTWQRFEGGHTNNDATNNYMNTTWGKGFKSINSVGVKAYPDLQTGANAFAQTLEGNRNYSGLLQGLRAGDPYALKDRVAAGLSTWLSGSPTKGLSYASKVLGSAVTPQGGSVGLDTAQPAPTPPSSLVPDTVAMNLTSGLSPQQQLNSLVTAVASQPRVAPLPVPAAATPPSGGAGTGTTTKAERTAANLITDYLGVPYVWGGKTPAGFDCSGLLQYVWGKSGVSIPRVTYDQWTTGAAVAKSQLRAGDAVFFHMGPKGPEHVGMYLGAGKFIEAPHTGANVRVSKLAGRKDFVGARRFA